jgi:hypothetical protein
MTRITHQTAVLAKEKGYSTRSEPYRYNKDGELTLLEGINAPAQSELQDWLRDEHAIFVTVDIDPDVYNGKINYSADVKNCDKNSDALGIRLLDGFTKYESYEEALEEGLLQALNLIP